MAFISNHFKSLITTDKADKLHNSMPERRHFRNAPALCRHMSNTSPLYSGDHTRPTKKGFSCCRDSQRCRHFSLRTKCSLTLPRKCHQGKWSDSLEPYFFDPTWPEEIAATKPLPPVVELFGRKWLKACRSNLVQALAPCHVKPFHQWSRGQLIRLNQSMMVIVMMDHFTAGMNEIQKQYSNKKLPCWNNHPSPGSEVVRQGISMATHSTPSIKRVYRWHFDPAWSTLPSFRQRRACASLWWSQSVFQLRHSWRCFSSV